MSGAGAFMVRFGRCTELCRVLSLCSWHPTKVPTLTKFKSQPLSAQLSEKSKAAGRLLRPIMRSLLAARKFETADTCAPVENPAALQIFVRVKKGAIIARIDADAAVVPPAIQVHQL